ncbi:YopX family protein [Staphylococcus sp. 231237_7MaSpsaltlick]|uniref:YopX family protein n=1 Tax=Staphylococcus sp. 231237_7MaSpsaltlick TaxID=3367518 RepID=UPI00370BF42A
MIKFRAWDKESQRMFNVARFDFADYTVYSHLFSCDGYLGENLEIMQSTGLKDKNGIEIFEGDIVKDYYDFNFEVVSSPAGTWNIVNGKGGKILGNWEFDVEIIGNKFENSNIQVYSYR